MIQNFYWTKRKILLSSNKIKSTKIHFLYQKFIQKLTRENMSFLIKAADFVYMFIKAMFDENICLFSI